MAQLAKSLKDIGWEVFGSDHKGVYPPISTYLKDNAISYHEGYSADNLFKNLDLVVVGRSALMAGENNPEYLKALSIGCPVLSYPQVIQKYLIRKKSIVVAGTFGKTTSSAILAWILTNANLNPSYMTGGIPLNLKDGVRITESEYSVVEGDETPALLETDPPKFMFYRPKYLMITASFHDHPEVYKTKKKYTQVFVDLVKLLPKEGILVYNLNKVDKIIVDSFSGEKISYSLEDSKADFFVKDISTNNNFTRFTLGGRKEINLETSLLGKHNLENICGVVALSLGLGIEIKIITASIKTFLGIKTRLEFLGKIHGRFLYWDFAQHPAKVKGTLSALRDHYANNKIICVFYPAMTGLKFKESLKWYPGNFDLADQVVVSKVGFLSKNRGNRVTGDNIVSAIATTQKNVFYEPADEQIQKYLMQNTKPGDVIVFMSSGGLRFTDLIKKVTEGLGGKDGSAV